MAKPDLERAMRDHLQGRGRDWATAKELAMEVGYPWRAVARLMMRLADDRLVEQGHHEWISARQRTRRCFIYRHVVTAHAEFPHWLMSQVIATDGTGYVHRLGDDDVED